MVDSFDIDRGLFGISVAAELTGVTPQALRGYEDKGLLAPERTDGGTRRYSRRDIERVEQITTLLAAGVNLTGIAHVLELEAETERLRAEVERLESESSRRRRG